ncbi:type VI secretion system secreted protein VgrG [Nitrosomonas aestuarii]|uniref:Lysozyme n=1 Tax=Nitrosomonas aestuarii TaxID=52441 RepID=A0A1I4B5Q0_9PROT|nr:lysozyme [Nitrosomonas aestuarii]SFK63690.1 type VI secretion system secreted protein VgrG [Nitrosomonas aestuarii]
MESVKKQTTINVVTKASDKGINLLKSIEVLKLKPYDDDTGRLITEWCDGATIGYGHLITQREWQTFCNGYLSGITEYYADHLFRCDLNRFELAVNRYVTANISQHQYDALVMFSFNIGVEGFRTSSALKLVNNPRAITNYSSLETAWKAWNKETKNGIKEISDGLVNRRQCEWNVFMKAIYRRW